MKLQVGNTAYETETTVEISESLAAKQERRVCQVKTHRERYQVWGGRDAALAGSWGAVDTRPCYIVMLEFIWGVECTLAVIGTGGPVK
eukprot:1187056-Prorocentrum_minimum.AAC.2